MKSQVWPVSQRLLHWGIVLSIVIAWVSAGVWDDIHDWSGYILFVLIGIRLVLAFSSRHPNASGKNMYRKLLGLGRYLEHLKQGKFSKTRGLSPSGVITVASLIILMFAVNYTGLMLTFEDYVGEPWLEELHADLFYYSLPLVVIHVAGAIVFSKLQKENKIKDMLDGG